jgi:hypothetical protein
VSAPTDLSDNKIGDSSREIPGFSGFFLAIFS